MISQTNNYEPALKALKKYPKLDQWIQYRRLEITHPYYPGRDENIGGGRPINKVDRHVEDQAIQLSMDPKLMYYQYVQKSVQVCLDLADSETQKIIEELYFKQTDLNSEGIAQKLHMSRKTLYKRRNAFLERLNELMSTIKVPN
ncbi:hypothetical protein [Lentilactobacillus sunkii]|uniref:hypothetical protein n=1 Tax=Lentilactobacillus sunkii TaxID=481719 RepID=UPI00070E574D|nr:hypothetical protein [Lentilactobacillus sunkii]